MGPSARRVVSRWVESGLLKAPPEMVQTAMERAWASIAFFIAYQQEGIYVSPEVQEAARKEAGDRRDRSFTLYLDLKGWPYLRNFKGVKDRAVAIVERELDSAEEDLEEAQRVYDILSQRSDLTHLDEVLADESLREALRGAHNWHIWQALDGEEPSDKVRVPVFLRVLYGLTPVEQRPISEIRRMLKEVKSDSPEQLIEAALRVIPKGFISITVDLDFTTRSSSNGAYEWDRHVLTLYPLTPLRPTTSDPRRKGLNAIYTYDKLKVSVANTIRHELDHMSQELIEVLAGLPKGSAGLPSRSMRNLRFNPSGVDVERLEEGKTSVPKDYLLRDVEFYPWLSDEVALFKRVFQQEGVPPELWDDARRVWVGAKRGPLRGHFMYKGKRKPTTYDLDRGGVQNFLYALKRSEPAKWRKAVGEFWKATEGGP